MATTQTSSDQYYENNGTTGNEIPVPQTTGVPNVNSDFVGPTEQLTSQGIPAGREMGVAFDDEGNLKPGWTLDPSGRYYTETDPSYVDQATIQQASADRAAYQSSQAFDSSGNLKDGYTYDENGTPVKSTVVSQQQAESSSNADDGSDPYVSKGQSTIAPEEDPFEKARQDSAAAYDAPGPTEADVIAANEPQPGGDSGTKTETSEDNSPWVTEGGYQAIYALNKDVIKNPDLIYPGQVFKMPNGGTYTVAKGDTLTAIAQGRGKGKYSLTVSKQVPDNNPKDTGISVPKKQKLVKNDFKQKPDWRVRLSLAPHATYLYKAANSPTNILYPLSLTDGVVFPYTPQIQVNYTANYDGTDLTHSNYKMYQYKNSEVGAIQITATFTAQDVNEANYLLAVIHFFRSVTKMFYGQDDNPKAGTPPPLVYLSGYGAHQFDNHPMAITSFNMSLPDDVDYIRAGTYSTYSATPGAQKEKPAATGFWDSVKARLSSSKLKKGGVKDQPTFTSLGNSEATYVPTKVQFAITGVPIVTRNDISNNFSLEKYASGELLRGSKRQQGGGGIW